MSGLVGKKIGMTSLFDDKGKNVPCTIIEAGPCTVTQIKNNTKDGESGWDGVKRAQVDGLMEAIDQVLKRATSKSSSTSTTTVS